MSFKETTQQIVQGDRLKHQVETIVNAANAFIEGDRGADVNR